MHVHFKRIRNRNIPIDLQVYLFDHTILPIALYGCEIWGLSTVSFSLSHWYPGSGVVLDCIDS